MVRQILFIKVTYLQCGQIWLSTLHRGWERYHTLLSGPEGYFSILRTRMRNIIRTSHDARRRSSATGADFSQGSPINARRPSGPSPFVLPRRASSSVFELSSRRDSGASSESLPKINENDGHGASYGAKACSVQAKASQPGQFMRHRSLGIIKFESDSKEDKSMLGKRTRKKDDSLKIKKRRIAAMLTIIITFLLFVVLLTMYVKKLIKEYFR